MDGGGFTVAEGEVFGIPGPDGAGRTTTVACGEGLRRPDSGSVRIAGLDPVTDHDRLTLALAPASRRAGASREFTVREAQELYAAPCPRPTRRTGRRPGPRGARARSASRRLGADT